MIKTISAALLSLSLLSPAMAWDIKDMNRTIDNTNFVVNEGCSGTLIDAQKGYILTAQHCVTQQYETVVVEDIAADGTVTTRKVRRAKDGTVKTLRIEGGEKTVEVSYLVRPVASSVEKDLALLQIAHSPTYFEKSSPISCTPPVRGEEVFVVGNPMGLLYASVVKGMVSSVQRSYNLLGLSRKDQLMQIAGGIVGGNSGGAVYNTEGKIVGVPVLGHRINEVLGFAVPTQDILDFVKPYGVTCG